MGTLRFLPTEPGTPTPQVRPRVPALRVTLETGDPATDAALGVVSIHVGVVGGRAPMRLYLYVNGDLAEAWSDSEGAYDLSLDEYGPGRHAVTARAVDALGRWAGASMVVACVGLEEAEEAPAERPALTPPCAEPSRGARTTPTSRAGR
jgi:hypothetical protein